MSLALSDFQYFQTFVRNHIPPLMFSIHWTWRKSPVGLDLKCSNKAHVLKAWPLLGGGKTFRRYCLDENSPLSGIALQPMV